MADTGIRFNLSGASTALPSTMDGRGTYLFEPPKVVRKNGLGEAVTAGFAKLTWKWKKLTKTQMDFLHTSILAGAASRTLTGTNIVRLYDHTNTLTYFKNCVIQRPTFEIVTGALYHGVVWEIDQIL